MSSIAMWWFGEAGKWDLIAKANLVDPNRLHIGQVLRLPSKDALRTPTGRQAGSRTLSHVVGSGDTLSSIASSFYGDIGRWRVIYEANRALIGADPDRLAVGMRLVIPAAR